jgi:hypothetical protein
MKPFHFLIATFQAPASNASHHKETDTGEKTESKSMLIEIAI